MFKQAKYVSSNIAFCFFYLEQSLDVKMYNLVKGKSLKRIEIHFRIPDTNHYVCLLRFLGLKCMIKKFITRN